MFVLELQELDLKGLHCILAWEGVKTKIVVASRNTDCVCVCGGGGGTCTHTHMLVCVNAYLRE